VSEHNPEPEPLTQAVDDSGTVAEPLDQSPPDAPAPEGTANGEVAEPLDQSGSEVAEPLGQTSTEVDGAGVGSPEVAEAAQAPEAVADIAGQAADEGEGAGEDADEGVEDGLAPLGDDELECALEALLLVVDSPVEEDALATVVNSTPGRVAERLRLLADRYSDQDRGIDLRRAGGGWRFYTRDRYAPYVEKLLLDGQRAKLTRAALETLAVIAYRQPVTRARVAAVRGVNCDGVIRTLLARGLVEETGTDLETGGFLYRTTELFLERLGLSSLDDLPPIAPLLPEVDSIDEL